MSCVCNCHRNYGLSSICALFYLCTTFYPSCQSLLLQCYKTNRLSLLSFAPRKWKFRGSYICFCFCFFTLTFFASLLHSQKSWKMLHFSRCLNLCARKEKVWGRFFSSFHYSLSTKLIFYFSFKRDAACQKVMYLSCVTNVVHTHIVQYLHFMHAGIASTPYVFFRFFLIEFMFKRFFFLILRNIAFNSSLGLHFSCHEKYEL